MPSKSKKQAKFMQAIAHSRKFAKKAGVPQSVGKEFNRADKRKRKAKDSAMSKFAADEIKHDPHSGQFSSGASAAVSANDHVKASFHHAKQGAAHREAAEQHEVANNLPKATAHKEAAHLHSAAADAHFSASRDTRQSRGGGSSQAAHHATIRANDASERATRA